MAITREINFETNQLINWPPLVNHLWQLSLFTHKFYVQTHTSSPEMRMHDNNRQKLIMFLLSLTSLSSISYTGMLTRCWSLGLCVSELRFSSIWAQVTVTYSDALKSKGSWKTLQLLDFFCQAQALTSILQNSHLVPNAHTAQSPLRQNQLINWPSLVNL